MGGESGSLILRHSFRGGHGVFDRSEVLVLSLVVSFMVTDLS